jgi:hypothetical protein
VIQATQVSRPTSPGWITWILLVGAVVLFAWGWFVLGFLREPSAIGGVFIALLVIGGGSIAASALGLIAAAGLLRGERWAHTVAMAASVAMILSVLGLVAGIPALVGLFASRNSTTN